MFTKSEIRAICREKLASITRKQEKSFKMKEELLPLLKGYNHIALFASLTDEIDTFPLIEELLKQDKIIYLPKAEGNDLNFYQITRLEDLEISKDKYHIRQPKGGNPVNPKDIEIIICPGVAFDKHHNRLGHGKGYYDRYLSKCSTYKIGVCYIEQLFDEIPADKYDIKMDEVYAY